jgi:hypothetical protein
MGKEKKSHQANTRENFLIFNEEMQWINNNMWSTIICTHFTTLMKRWRPMKAMSVNQVTNDDSDVSSDKLCHQHCGTACQPKHQSYRCRFHISTQVNLFK